MPDTSLADKLKTWNFVVTTMEPDLEELSFLREEHEALKTVVAEIEALDAEEEAHTSRQREANRKRTDAERRGTEIYGRIAFILRGHHGKKSQRLIKYGLAPLATRKRRSRDGQGNNQPSPSAPTAAEEPAE
jgi:hypothetical protein